MIFCKKSHIRIIKFARQTHFRGNFTTNDEILALSDVSKGNYANSSEDLLIRLYDTSWYETDQIVPDQVTPASDATPLSDGTATAEFSIEYSRRDHGHLLNVTTTIPPSDFASGSINASTVQIGNCVDANGTSAFYARHDQVRP
ncbi:MAG: hypothetical protein EZS28_028521 [Streblomastix strix]|uniref:Uncharacterized protein n=1 Tax=Streblomastix strix TaxID=222440 RepID=A0A5J4V0N1_9EUKA|nr:MAG: hypothetical protein EZS28_028521 [Streblomastix strix]